MDRLMLAEKLESLRLCIARTEQRRVERLDRLLPQEPPTPTSPG